MLPNPQLYLGFYLEPLLPYPKTQQLYDIRRTSRNSVVLGGHHKIDILFCSAKIELHRQCESLKRHGNDTIPSGPL